MNLKVLIFNFVCNEPLNANAEKLRGFFANSFEEYTLIHQHLENNKFLYKAPLIQYKILKGKPFVLGIKEGAEILQSIFDEVSKIKIGNKEYFIKEKNIILRTDYFGNSNFFIFFKFLTPWLALNEKNFKKYMEIEEENDKKEFLNKILIGNIISLSKSIGYTVEKAIEAKILKFKEVSVKLKGVKMIGFLGNFKVNFEIPDYFGLGKSVSRGFGTIKKINSNISSTSNVSK